MEEAHGVGTRLLAVNTDIPIRHVGGAMTSERSYCFDRDVFLRKNGAERAASRVHRNEHILWTPLQLSCNIKLRVLVNAQFLANALNGYTKS